MNVIVNTVKRKLQGFLPTAKRQPLLCLNAVMDKTCPGFLHRQKSCAYRNRRKISAAMNTDRSTLVTFCHFSQESIT